VRLPLPFSFKIIMETVSIFDIMNAVTGLARDLLIYLAPLIGLIAGMKFVADWLHKILFGRKV
jgi:hypothetical protein